MNKFGELTTTLEQVDVQLRTLYYEHEERLFVVGGRECNVSDEDVDKELKFANGEPVTKEQINTHPVLLGTWGNPITTPKFYSWLRAGDKSANFQQTARVMKEVFEDVSQEKLDGKRHDEMHPLGFSASLQREGHINLSVLGNCACLGTDPDGHLVDWNEWDSGYTELALHNIDTKPQYVSIMAGLGHLALRCGEETF